MIGYLVAGIIGATVGLVVMAALAIQRRGFLDVVCGHCAREARVGPRRQLFVELWDANGVQYNQWPVGVGELLTTRKVDGELLALIRADVERLNALQAVTMVAPDLKVVAP